jgi:hypothetical protein
MTSKNLISIIYACTVMMVSAAAGPAHGQTVRRAAMPAGYEEVEGVAAVVGDTLIALSELRRAMGSQMATQQLVPTDIERPRSAQALRLQVLQSLIDNALVLRAARELAVTVEEREIDQQIG